MDTDSPEDMAVQVNNRESKEEEETQMSNVKTQNEEEDHEVVLERNLIDTVHIVHSSENNVNSDTVINRNENEFVKTEIFEVLNDTVDKACQLVKSDYCIKEQNVNASEKIELKDASSECAVEENVETGLDAPMVFVPSYDFHNFHKITSATKDFVSTDSSRNIFLKGCKWSPDGTCLLTNSDDNCLRLFDLPLCLYEQHVLTSSISSLPELSAVLKIKHGGTVYDFTWFPYMTSLDHETCCFVSTSSNAPVQLWDAFTGQLRASYRGYDQYDEVMAATSVAFSATGDKLYCGYYNSVKVFSSDKPGRDYDNVNIKEVSGQTGIVSCIAVSPCMPNIYAVGTYQKTVGLYTDEGTAVCLLKGQMRGLTHIQFSPDGYLLYTGGRKDEDILCWDLRNLGQVLYTLQRTVTTNQRIYFDITHDGKYLVSGSTDGSVSVWDTTKYMSTDYSDYSAIVLKPTDQWTAHNDCTNGISIHRHLPLLATSSGQRHASSITEEDSSPPTCGSDVIENCVKLWWIGPTEKYQS